MKLNKSKFISFVTVRPDDIDMNDHVHSSRYMDYVLAARYDQMGRCYGFSMEEFVKLGFGWVMTDSYMQFKRALIMGDIAEVTTWMEGFEKNLVEVHFTMTKKGNSKLVCQGWFKYSMIELHTGKAAIVPKEIVEKYSI